MQISILWLSFTDVRLCGTAYGGIKDTKNKSSYLWHVRYVVNKKDSQWWVGNERASSGCYFGKFNGGSNERL